MWLHLQSILKAERLNEKKYIQNCLHCKSDFIVRPSVPKVYCSKKCFLDRKEDRAVICIMCRKEFKDIFSGRKKLCSRRCYHKYQSVFLVGEKSVGWKGGKTEENLKIRSTVEYKEWRLSVFKRDNFTCTNCKAKGIPIQAHHIMSFAEYPEKRTELSNGLTLCVSCHKKIYHSKIDRRPTTNIITKRIDSATEEVVIFESILKAAESIGISYRKCKARIRTKQPCNGYYFEL